MPARPVVHLVLAVHQVLHKDISSKNFTLCRLLRTWRHGAKVYQQGNDVLNFTPARRVVSFGHMVSSVVAIPAKDDAWVQI